MQAFVRDGETNLSKSNIRVFVDGRPTSAFSYDAGTDRLYFTPTFAPGSQKVRIEATDSGGNTGAFAWGFGVR